MLWIDSFFMTTDGTYVIVTELSDPMQVKPLKYGSAEEDPDPSSASSNIATKPMSSAATPSSRSRTSAATASRSQPTLA
jgi:hypothetical protein